jgi:hypothetical protein
MKPLAYVTMNRLTHSWLIMQPNKNGGFSPCAAYARLVDASNACDAINYPGYYNSFRNHIQVA